MKNRKKNTKLILLLLLICITLGYAALRTQLNINGTATIPRVVWDVHFENVQNTQNCNVTPTSRTEPVAADKATTISYVVSLEEPGDVYEFTVDVVNGGTIDAMIENISSKLNDTEIDNEHPVPAYLDYSVTYVDDLDIEENQLLEASNSETYKVRLAFKENVDPEVLPGTATTLHLDLTVNYIQADNTAIPVRATDANFATDSWDTIIQASKAANPTQLRADMAAGTTRAVPLDLDLDGTSDTICNLRIVNLSTPAECSTSGFSQTACGLVLQCANEIAKHRMNSGSGYTLVDRIGNVGGWPASEMRAYLNDDTANTQSIYNALPSDLRSKIIPTYVVSGHGSTSGETNFTSTDRLYLLSTLEVLEGGASRDTAKEETRTMDYYKTNVLDESQYYGLNAIWWTRTPISNGTLQFYFIGDVSAAEYTNGTADSGNSYGVYPAFRIG